MRITDLNLPDNGIVVKIEIPIGCSYTLSSNMVIEAYNQNGRRELIRVNPDKVTIKIIEE